MRFCCPGLMCLVTAAGLAGTLAIAQPPAEKPKAPVKAPAPQPPAKPADKVPAGQPAMTPEMQAEMEAWMKAAQPGKQHEFLAKSVGNWDGKCKSWEIPGAPPVESTCTASNTSMLGGRFTHCEFHGSMMGQPFEGHGVFGYDNASQKYQMTWIDSMGTGMMHGTGEPSADMKTMTWTMTCTNPMTKKTMTMREVDHFISDNEMSMEMFGPDPTGKEMKMMEVTYTRKGGAPAKAPAPKPAGK